MSSSQLQDSSVGSSLEDYDKFFDAHKTFTEQQRSATSHRLPLGDEGYEVPTPYDRELQQLDVNAHHSAAYYLHPHQTLKSSEGRRRRKKKDRDSAYKKRKGSRPSQLFQPSLQEVAEQGPEHQHTEQSDEVDEILYEAETEADEILHEAEANSTPDTNSVGLSGNNNAVLNPTEDVLASPQAPVIPGHQSDGSTHSGANVTFVLGDATDQDSVDGGLRLVMPKEIGAPTLPGNRTAPGQLPTLTRERVKFQLGGEGSQANVMEAAQKTMEEPQVVSEEQVRFIVGGESTDNFQQRDAVGIAKVSTQAEKTRSHSTDEPPTGERFHALKARSYSYHPGDDLAYRRCRGSDVELSDLPNKMAATITSPEEAALLNKHDLEDLATHRFERLRGYDKHKINKRSMAKMSGVGMFDEPVAPRIPCDLTPHELFVELDELVIHQHDNIKDLMEWKEKARWIKFEEDVLDASDRWGRPHVASLSFHSLIELRRLLESGVVQVDVEAHDYMSLMQTAIDKLTVRRDLTPEQQDYVMEALILRHSHQDGKPRFARSKSYSNLMGLDSMTRHSRSSHIHGVKGSSVHMSNAKNCHLDSHNHIALNMLNDNSDNPLITRNSKSYAANLDKERYNMELLKKIPQDAEVASVLVGTLDKLEKPCTVLFRLSQGLMLDHVAEVPLPVRFLFVCVGPPLHTIDYVEIGRSLSTLLSNKKFREAAYRAKGSSDMLTAMNAFLDESIVLPPGDFDKKTLLPIMHMARKRMNERKAKADADNAQSSGAGGADKPPDDSLSRTGRAFGGLVKDIRRKCPHYLSDFKDGLNPQVIAAFIFIYFACLSPAITFGGLLGEKTDDYMGASEMLMATAVSGVLFSLMGGQPLLITGFTGPNMVFEEGVYKFSKDFGIDLLTWRLWIGIWVFIIGVVLVATEASFLVKYVSRFTQDIFAFLISMIFIYEVFKKLIKVFRKHPLCKDYVECLSQVSNYGSSSASPPLYPNITSAHNMTFNVTWTVETTPSIKDVKAAIVGPNTALLTMSLTLFTFVVAYALRGLRHKKVLGRTIRRALGDFGVPLAILLMCLIDFFIGDRVYTQKLTVPIKFSVTDPTKRGWFISPIGSPTKPFPVVHMFSALLPAILGSILIFMESLIAGVIVDKKENKLRKGSGFHLDILVLGFIALINGCLGVPFVCAATVRSVAHTSALTVMSTNHAPGERPKLERVIEQRVSNLLVHILITASMFLGMVLRYIPTAVLFGVFLYMGIASLSGIQLFDRIMLLITPAKHHPVDVGYVRNVRAMKMHFFTIIQVLCVGVLWAVKLSPGALAFPFILVLLVPLRLFIMKFAFTPQELSELDSEDDCKVLVAAEEDDLDFYETAHMPD